MEPIPNMTVDSYLSALGSGDAVPGGGAASAVAAAQGAALLAMSLRVSGGGDDGSRMLLSRLDTARGHLLELATKDGAAFESVMAALKLPRQTDEQKIHRKAAIQTALKAAAEPPMQVMKEAFSLLKDASFVVAHSKPTVVSDAGIALHLLWSAMVTARFNVWINLKSIDDADFSTKLREDMRHMIHDGKKLRRRLSKQARNIAGI